MWEKIAKAWIWLTFGGILFCTSPSFLEPYIVPKYLLAIFVFCLSLLFVSITGIPAGRYKHLLDFTLLQGLYLIGLVEAVYGIIQYYGIWSHSPTGFQVVGSFDNPAGIACVLTLLLPIGIFWFKHSQGTSRISVILSLTIYLYAIYCTGSRTALLAILISALVLILVNMPDIARKVGRWRLIMIGVLVSAVAVVALYKIRPDSANGRLLIWEVCSEMMKDKPLLGFGPGGFPKNYMNYQAEYFRNNPDSPFAQLASNIQHPMNLFVKMGVEFGIVGLVLLIVFICYACRIAFKYSGGYRSLVLSAFASIVVWGMFSYPERYPTTWILLAIYFFYALNEYRPKYTTPGYTRVFLRSACAMLAVWGIILVYRQTDAQIKWKDTVSVWSGQPQNIYLKPYKDLFPLLKGNPYFLYNYAAVLNNAGEWRQSQEILTLYQQYFYDYDLLLMQGDNSWHLQEYETAESLYRQAANMIPCRFMPLYKQLEMYISTGNTEKAREIAEIITDKTIKVPSSTVFSIRRKAAAYLCSSEVR